jgi:hypothetical protein
MMHTRQPKDEGDVHGLSGGKNITQKIITWISILVSFDCQKNDSSTKRQSKSMRFV